MKIGKTAFFRDWTGLIGTLNRLIEKSAAMQEGLPAEPQRADDEQ